MGLSPGSATDERVTLCNFLGLSSLQASFSHSKSEKHDTYLHKFITAQTHFTNEKRGSEIK